MAGKLQLSRRRLLRSAGAYGASLALGSVGMPFVSRAADRPLVTHGVQSGDVSLDSGVIWSRTDRASRMLVEIATSDSFRDPSHAMALDTLPDSDFTAKVLINDLPAGQDIFYRIRFQNLAYPTVTSEPVIGRFRTAPRDQRSVFCSSSSREGRFFAPLNCALQMRA